MLNAFTQVNTLRKRGAWEITTDTIRNVRRLVTRRHPAEIPLADGQSPLNNLPTERCLDIIEFLSEKDRQALLFTNYKYATLVLHQKYRERLKTILVKTLSPKLLNNLGGIYEQSQHLFSLQQCEIDYFLQNANQIIERRSLSNYIRLSPESDSKIMHAIRPFLTKYPYASTLATGLAIPSHLLLLYWDWRVFSLYAPFAAVCLDAWSNHYYIAHFKTLYDNLKSQLDQLKTLPNDITPRSLIIRNQLLDQINTTIVLLVFTENAWLPKNDTIANYSSCHLTRFPEALFNNPNFSSHLKNCEEILLGSNKLHFLPKGLNRFEKLRFINLANNAFTEFPKAILDLPLARVDILHNYLNEIDEDVSDTDLYCDFGISTKEYALQHQHKRPLATIKTKPD